MKRAFTRIILRTGLYVCSVALLLATHVSAQTPTHRPRAVYPADSQSSSARRAAIRKNGRFLGWKFAALSGQNTRKWQRTSPQNQQLLAIETGYNSVWPRSAVAAASGFGNAGFEARPSLPAGFIPTAITNGDFNGDGKMDFAICNGGDNTIYVFLGNGDGTFKVPEILYTQGQSPDWITAVDRKGNQE